MRTCFAFSRPDPRFAVALLLAVFVAGPTVSVRAEEDELADKMSEINSNYKKLRRASRKKAFSEEHKELVAEMIELSKACKEMEPPMAANFSGAEKEKFIAGYRESMDGLISALNDLHTALAEGKSEEAAEMIGNLNALKKEGHDRYVED